MVRRAHGRNVQQHLGCAFKRDALPRRTQTRPFNPQPICPRPKTKQVNHFIAARMAALWKATVGEGAATVVPDADKGVWADVHA